MGFLLSLIPAPWLAVAKGLPWRLIGYCAAALAVLLFAWRVHAWHQGFLREEATEKALEESKAEVAEYHREQAIIEQARAAAAAKAIRDQQAAIEVENALQAKLANSDAHGRDMARRLRDAQTRLGALSALATTPGQPATAPGESGDGEAIERATADHFAACERDAARLSAWQSWWAEVSANR